jgi:ADP-heptose:LPS heptosyltransferase/glycosyltransferase involved in cell wall biosynthesis
MPPKAFHGPEEPRISDDERDVNRWLAAHLFANVMRGEPGPTLDIGAKVPVLASAFADLGCAASAMEPCADVSAHANVRMLRDDFEAHEPCDRYRLITLVHVFEHFYNPLDALRKMRRMVADGGRVFIRMPDHTVPGYERDLTAHHYAIHPFFHCLSGVCEMLVQLGDAFTVESHGVPGPGQRDIVLRPIDKAPTLGVGMIVKNEERDLPRCLRSIASIADGVVVIDTGSTDRTVAVAHDTITAPVWARTYLDASEQEPGGDWRIVNFAKARNQYVEEVRERGFTHTLSMDADDELLAPAAIRQAMYLPPAVVGVFMDLGNNWRQVHHRLWPADWPVHYKGWCHEFPVIDGLPCVILNHECIRHDATPHGNETSNDRNLRILLRQFEAEPDSRTAFYIANTHKDGGRHALAIDWYRKRLEYGAAFRDEYLFALLYLARAQGESGDLDGGMATADAGLAMAPDWQEFRMHRATTYYQQGRYRDAIKEAAQAIDAPVPVTILWRERGAYRDQPLRMISWCHEHLGDKAQALEWAVRAQAAIGHDDAQWQARIVGLRATQTRAAGARERICLHRPGAIGDILMTLNLVPALREQYPDADIVYACDGGFIGDGNLDAMIRAAGVDSVIDLQTLHDARPGYFSRVIDLVGYPMHEGYPYRPMQKHLLRYFADEMGVPLPDEGLPALVVPLPASPVAIPGPYATLQVKAGWSPYKNWQLARWAAVVDALSAIQFIQIGAHGDPLVPGAINLTGMPLHDSIAVVANAALHVGVDSFANHLTNYVWQSGNSARRVPGVIVWGSTQPSAAGYPDNANVYKLPACGPCFRESPDKSRQRTDPCPNDHACMDAIRVDDVVAAVQSKWSAAA